MTNDLTFVRLLTLRRGITLNGIIKMLVERGKSSNFFLFLFFFYGGQQLPFAAAKLWIVVYTRYVSSSPYFFCSLSH